MANQMSCMLVCGYRRTGKDSLKDIINAHSENRSSEYSWRVYSMNDKPFPMDRRIRRALADELKKEVHEKLGITQYDPLFLELSKDQMMVGSKTLRQHYIDHAKECRDKDPLYFCKKIEFDPNENYILTDWRNFNEFVYFSSILKVVTVRVFRSEVEVPPSSSVEEHYLDGIYTDYLLVTSEDEFKKAVELFPQCTTYKYLCNI